MQAETVLLVARLSASLQDLGDSSRLGSMVPGDEWAAEIFGGGGVWINLGHLQLLDSLGEHESQSILQTPT